MIKKIDVRRAAGETFVLDEVIFEKRFDRVALLDDEQLQEEKRESSQQEEKKTNLHVRIAFVSNEI